LHVVWPTLVSGATADVEPTLELFYAASSDGASFSPRRRLPTEGVPKHAQVAAAQDGSLIVVWEEQAPAPVASSRPGARRGSVHPSDCERCRPGCIRLLRWSEDSTVVAWTHEAKEQSVIQVTRLDNDSPPTPREARGSGDHHDERDPSQGGQRP